MLVYGAPGEKVSVVLIRRGGRAAHLIASVNIVLWPVHTLTAIDRTGLMKVIRLSATALVLSALVSSVSAQTGTVRRSPGTVVDSLMAPYNRTDSPGGVVAVVRNGKVIFARGYGMASLEHSTAITEETIFDVGSVSKQFTAFAIVLMSQEGKLSLDDDIRTYLPEVPKFGHTIRIRHLIHHTSGIREIYNALGIAGWQAGDGMVQADALRLVSRQRELNFEPGTEYAYCNTAYMILADIVTRISGDPFDEWMQRRVFGRLGMHNTTIMAERGQVISGAAESYVRTESGGLIRSFDNSGIMGAGGVYSNVFDLAKWIGNFADHVVGDENTMRQMIRRGVLASGDTLSYAFGLQIGEYRGLRQWSHGGSSAGYRSSLTYFPDLDAGVVTLSNYGSFDGGIRTGVIDAFFGSQLDPDDEIPVPPGHLPDREDPDSETYSLTDSELEEFEGVYFSPELQTSYTIGVRDGKLVASHRRHEDFELIPNALDRFESQVWFFSDVVFERGEGGGISGFRVSSGRVRNLWFVRR